MRKLTRLPWLTLVLLFSVPSLLQAQSGSVDTPNNLPVDALCPINPAVAHNVPRTGLPGNPRMGLRIKAVDPAGNNLPPVVVNPPDISLVACNTGLEVTNKSLVAAFNAAVAAGYTCTPAVGVCGAAGALLQVWDFTAPGKPCGFELIKAAGAGTSSFSVNPMTDGGAGFCNPVAQNVQTNSGNAVGTDLLPQYLVGVSPNGVDGLVAFRVFHTQGGQNPRTFTINTAGCDATAIHNDIKAGFNGTGLGLISSVLPASSVARFPEVFGAISPVVKISNAPTQLVTKIEVTGLPGQTITQETSVPLPPPTAAAVPALSPWGVVLLVGMVLLTGLWILGRRHRLSES